MLRKEFNFQMSQLNDAVDTQDQAAFVISATIVATSTTIEGK